MPKSSSAVRPSGQHEEVAAVEVAVEEAVDHRPLHEGDHAGADDLLGVDAGVAHSDDIVELEARQPLHHEHPAGHQAGVRAGHDVAPLPELGQHLGDVEHVGRLEPEVQLLDDRLREQLHQRRRVGQRGDRDPSDQVGRQPRHRPQVLAHQRGDLGPLHLDDDRLAGVEGRRVDLGDRRRGQRRAVEPGEGGLEGGAEVGLDHLPHDRERLGRDLVAAALELLDQLGREEALAGGDDLAELDVGRAERLGGEAQPAGEVGTAGLGRRVAVAALADQPRDERGREPRGHTARRGPPAAGWSAPSARGSPARPRRAGDRRRAARPSRPGRSPRAGAR